MKFGASRTKVTEQKERVGGVGAVNNRKLAIYGIYRGFFAPETIFCVFVMFWEQTDTIHTHRKLSFFSYFDRLAVQV